MLNLFKRRRPSSPLFDFIKGVTPQRAANFLDANVNSPRIVGLSIFMFTNALAGHFLRGIDEEDSIPMEADSRDVFAFETLAFAAFGLRDQYTRLALEDGNRNLSPVASDGFRHGLELGCKMILDTTKWNCRKLFYDRVISYVKVGGIGDPKEAAERFRFLLMTIGKAQSPCAEYGRVSLDLAGTVQSYAAVMAFAATMPKGYAETLRNVGEELNIAGL